MKTRAIRSRPRRKKGGFSLLEVLVALTLLSLILMGLARVTFQMAASGRTNDTVAKRNAALVEEANKFNAMQFAALATVNTTTTDLTYGDFKFQRRLTITTGGTNWRTIKIVITPYVGGVLMTSKKDSVTVTRSLAPGSPLCTTCG